MGSKEGGETDGVIQWLTKVHINSKSASEIKRKTKSAKEIYFPKTLNSDMADMALVKMEKHWSLLLQPPPPPFDSFYFCNFPCQRTACADTWFFERHSCQSKYMMYVCNHFILLTVKCMAASDLSKWWQWYACPHASTHTFDVWHSLWRPLKRALLA